MPRLPSAQDFGIPVPTARRGTPSGGMAAAEVERGAQIAAHQVSPVAQTLQNTSKAFLAAQRSIESRTDAINSARAITDFDTFATDEFRRFQTEEDLSDPEALGKYRQFLDERLSQTLGSFSGSADASARLSARLQLMRREHFDGMASNVLTAQRERVKSVLSANLNNLTSKAFQNPASINSLFGHLDQDIDMMAGQLTAEEQLSLQTGGRAQIVTAAVESLLDAGGYAQAQAVLDNNPDFAKFLGPAEKQLRIRINRQAQSRENFDSPLGKLLQDRRRAIVQFGADSKEVRIIDAALSSEKDSAPDVQSHIGLFKEYSRQSADFVAASEGFSRVEAAASLGTVAGDTALLYGYMKIIDPGAIVTEGDMATAQNAGGVPGAIRNMYNSAIGGAELLPQQRQEILQAASSQFTSLLETQRGRDGVFTNLSMQLGLDPRTTVQSPVSSGLIARARELSQVTAIAQPQQNAPAGDQVILQRGLENVTPEDVKKLSPSGRKQLRQMISNAKSKAMTAEAP